jgi:hypothetical protein
MWSDSEGQTEQRRAKSGSAAPWPESWAESGALAALEVLSAKDLGPTLFRLLTGLL